MLQKIIPKPEISGYAELVLEGEDLERDLLIDKLISGGYQRAAVVEEPGDFCVRGGIVDIYTPLYSEPIRIELFWRQRRLFTFFFPGYPANHPQDIGSRDPAGQRSDIETGSAARFYRQSPGRGGEIQDAGDKVKDLCPPNQG